MPRSARSWSRACARPSSTVSKAAASRPRARLAAGQPGGIHRRRGAESLACFVPSHLPALVAHELPGTPGRLGGFRRTALAEGDPGQVVQLSATSREPGATLSRMASACSCYSPRTLQIALVRDNVRQVVQAEGDFKGAGRQLLSDGERPLVIFPSRRQIPLVASDEA